MFEIVGNLEGIVCRSSQVTDRPLRDPRRFYSTASDRSSEQLRHQLTCLHPQHELVKTLELRLGGLREPLCELDRAMSESQHVVYLACLQPKQGVSLRPGLRDLYQGTNPRNRNWPTRQTILALPPEE